MNRQPRSTSWTLLLVIVTVALLAHTATAMAAQVRVSVSAREVYVNEAFSLVVEIINAQEYQRPELPKIPGVAVNTTPSQSTQMMTSVVNGRASTTETVTLTYRFVPYQAGTITIPPITVEADGETFTSHPIEIIVTQSETGDLMFAEILADRLTLYLGEPLHVRLRLWIKPYSDRQLDKRLTSEQMWSLLDANATNWGDFEDALMMHAGPLGSVTLTGEEVIRTDADGNRGAYYQYDINATIWPTRTGPVEFQQPTIVVNYPVRLALRRDFFSRESLAIASARPISITADPPPVEVISPPSDGQPPVFNGAVGNYSITTSASPTEVAVGDPITLTIVVVDQGNATHAANRLSVLPPPPLDRVEELIANFRSPSDPLAGTIRGNAKVFTHTIRAKSANVTRIPPIPMSFFDPASEAYITRSSDPIAITVKPGTQIGVNDIVAAPSTAMPQARSDVRAVSGGILANDAADEALTPVEPFRLNAAWIAAVAVPPLVFAVIAVSRTSARFRQKNAASIRRRSAGRRAIARIKSARNDDSRMQAQTILAAFCDYVADRLNLPARWFTSPEIGSLLQQHAADAAFVGDVERLLDECEQSVYAGRVDAARQDDSAGRAITFIKRLERVRMT